MRSIFFLFVLILVCNVRAQNKFDVFVFSKTSGFRHSSIAEGKIAIIDLSEVYGFGTVFSEDASFFSQSNLDTIELVIFLNTSGDILNAEQESVFENYIKSGNGFVGVHAASDTEYDWSWYGELIGRYFNGHPRIQDASLSIFDSNHISTKHLQSPWMRKDEWYNFKTPFPDNLRVLVTIDESSYSGGDMGDFHPLSWSHYFDGGRSFYTAMGHTGSTYMEKEFRDHLAGGIIWAADTPPVITSPSSVSLQENDNGFVYLAESNEEVTFELGNEKDESQFKLQNGNQVEFIDPPDFENPKDKDFNNEYVVDLIASDSVGHNSVLEVTLRVSDVDETVLSVDERQSIVVYPNPSTDFLKIEVDQLQIFKVSITNLGGKKIVSLDLFDKEEIYVGWIKPGSYFLIMETSKGNYWTKFIKH